MKNYIYKALIILLIIGIIVSISLLSFSSTNKENESKLMRKDPRRNKIC